MNELRIAETTISLVLGLAVCAAAEVPQLINHQGRLVEGANLVNENVEMVLSLYDDPVAGNLLYADSNAVTVVDGLYETFLGDNTVSGSLADTLTNTQIYLEVRVNGTALLPRERVTSVAYSLVTEGVREGGVTGSMLADDAVTSDKIADGTISSNDMGTSSITSDAIADGSVSSGEIADGSVTSADLADTSVGSQQLEKKYQSGSVVFTSGSHFPFLPGSMTISYAEPFNQTPIVTANLDSDYPERLVELDGSVSISSRTESNFTAQLPGLGAGSVIGPLTLDEPGDVGTFLSLAVAVGHPVISYRDSSTPALKFVRANDPAGATWGTPLIIDTSGDPGWYISLAVINHRPAISYTDRSTLDLMYVTANDLHGFEWGTPTVVATLNDVTLGILGFSTSLAQVNNRPAICYFTLLPTFGIHYVQGNFDGTSWATPVPIGGSINAGTFSSLKVINGHPAISYYDESNKDLIYVRATDADGTAWGSPVAVSTGGVVGTYTSLEVVNGRPAISYRDVDNGHLEYVRAGDADGLTWGTPVEVDTVSDTGYNTSLAVIGGRPAIAYQLRIGGRSTLKFVWANDPDGASWGTPVGIDGGEFVGAYLSMAELEGKPAIGYFDSTSSDLKYMRGADLEPKPEKMIEVVDVGEDVGEHASLAWVNARLAISYHGDSENLEDLKYVRALNEKGTAWGTPVAVETNAQSGLSSSLAMINGRPAIGYSELIHILSSVLKYVRASDASGTSWGSPVTVDDVSNVRGEASLSEVNGRPAMAYNDFSPDFDLMYVRALDADGTSWDTPVGVATNNQIHTEVSLAVINGRPAIGYLDSTEQAMKYVRAADADGTAWGAPVTVAGAGTSHFSLVTVNGRPAISYRDFGASAVKYVRATDADGTGWNPAVTLDTNADGFQFSSLTVIGGLPTISYYDVTLSGLKYVQATDPDGTSWEAPITVETEGDVGPYNTVLDLNGRPGIGYHHETNGELRFFTEIEKPISINWIAVEP